MTEAEVKELLGEPEEEADTFLTYYLGIPQGIFGTSVDGEKEYLLISLDADGKATAAEVMTGKVLPKESKFRIISENTDDAVYFTTIYSIIQVFFKENIRGEV